MSFSVSDLLNPAPASQPASPNRGIGIDDVVPPSAMMDQEVFAPELFSDQATVDTPDFFQPSYSIPEPLPSPEFMRKDSITANMFDNNQTSIGNIIPMDISINGSPAIPTETAEISTAIEPAAQPVVKKERQKRNQDPERLKDTKHSSKNEGVHTDKRYLCYFCDKLFTRRRSVRDHIVKIHGEKTWEPRRSLEILVEPHSGEPLEPIEEVKARGPPPSPPPRPKKDRTESKAADDTTEKPDESVEGGDLPALTATVSQEAKDAALLFDTTIDAIMNVSALPEAQEQVTIEPAADLPTKVKVETLPDAVKSQPQTLLAEKITSSDTTHLQPQKQSPVPLIGKKRPLAATKKGTARPKISTPNKKVKLSESDRSTTGTRSPSVTPAIARVGSKLKKTFTNTASPSSRSSSRQPTASPTPEIGTPASAASSNEDGEVFCTCRTGDNHSWMIACDGPCEDWYHGKCVKIRERDGELIDKFFCDACTNLGHTTTWKRMCRRKECRKPARVRNEPPSKYCSPECGRMFFVELLQRGDDTVNTTRNGQFVLDQTENAQRRRKIKTKQKHRSANDPDVLMGDSRPATPIYSDDGKSEYETDDSVDENDLPSRGGALRAGEVKAILQRCRTTDEWRALGNKPDTPPRELEIPPPNILEDKSLRLDEFERAKASAIRDQLSSLQLDLSMYDAREQFVELVTARSLGITEPIEQGSKKGTKICGYDARLSWSEEQFRAWYEAGGKEKLAAGRIGSPDDDAVFMNETEEGNDRDDEDTAQHYKGGICIRNRCKKHGQSNWQKAQIAELRFEQELVRKRQSDLMKQQGDFMLRARMRALEQD